MNSDYSFTPAEAAVALRLKRGDSNKEIAQVLNKSVATVKHQVGSILRKLGVESRARAVARLHARTGVLEPV